MKEQDRISFDGNIHDIQRLKELQALPLERKIGITQARIMEFYREFDGQVYVSFSGGKDSTVLLDITRKLFPEVEAVFVDTGLEYPEIREFVKTKENVTWLKPKMNFRQVIEKYGYPVISKTVSRQISDVKKLGKDCYAWKCFTGEKTNKYDMRRYKYLIESPFNISNKCCDIMKKNTLKTIKDKRPIIGTMACESNQRSVSWIKNGCNMLDSKYPQSRPISFWTEQDILKYISQIKLSYASIYGDIVFKKNGIYKTTNLDRTGCMFCMFGCHLEKEPNRFQRMKISHPKIYEYCMKDIENGGLGLKKVLDFIGIKY